MNTNFFSIRVYGLWINDNHEIMLTDEYFQDKFLTKFPGGGLEFGEGIHECLKREWLEELNIEIDIIEHFYTTDFFQVSVFNPNAQIVSIYYLVKPLSVPDVKISNKVFDFDELKNG
ncbi:MAG: NUDIX hydrolase, partial [Candidatus Sericytochromatia bacterium]|nr:NUDIX hydrolase [Candidatus Sericytochromatia bacterium]